MERQEPMGYFGVHKEKKFPALCNEDDFVLKGMVQHDNKLHKVKLTDSKASLHVVVVVWFRSQASQKYMKRGSNQIL